MLYRKKLKRNLILLIGILAISFKSFSQTDTESSVILLTEPVAKLVVKDLVTFDGLLEESKAVREQLLNLDKKVLTLQEVIKNLQLQLENRNQVITQKDAQISTYSEMSSELEKALKRERRTKKIYQIGSAIGVAALLLNVLGK